MNVTTGYEEVSYTFEPTMHSGSMRVAGNNVPCIQKHYGTLEFQQLRLKIIGGNCGICVWFFWRWLE